jgi:dienelactone hydrolase
MTTKLKWLLKLLFFVTLSSTFAQDKEGAAPQPSTYADPKIGEQVFIPAKDSGFLGKEVDIVLEGTIYKPKGPGPFPLAILNHGSTDNGKISPKITYKWPWMASFLARERGFVVIYLMRRGRGMSGGNTDVSEPWSDCNQAVGVDNAIQDVHAAVSYARTLPYVDASRIVLVGVSRGGLLVNSYPGRHPDVPVNGTVNFVGGWANEMYCPYFNDRLFETAGQKSKVPSLWIYGDKDYNYSDSAIESYYESFQKGNGNALFKFYKDVPGGGHNIAARPEFWASDLDAFLSRIGFPKLPKLQ